MTKLIVSFGAGVNSAAMLVGMHERKISPDLILFADTGGEKPETYEFAHIMSTWTFLTFGIDIVRVRNDGKYESLETECLNRKTLPPIVMGWRTCSDKYKRRPILKYLNAGGYLNEPLEMAIGFGVDEAGRIGDFDTEFITNRYFLNEWGWDRTDCIAAIKRAGLPVPIKSACFFCPSSKKKEVLWLQKNHPDLMERAFAMENNADGLMVAGLGRHWSWQQVVKADADQFKLFQEMPDIPCGCFDGDE